MTLEVRDLSVRRGRRTVVQGVDLSIAAGEVVALLGPNGAGKSSLVEAIGSVIESTGSIQIDGRVATVLQTPGLAHRSVRANVDLAQAWWGVPRSGRRTNTDRALEALGIGAMARRNARTLSGGETRRVHLARGLAVGADLLLLDEPFAGLDPESHARLVDDIAGPLRSGGAVLIVLHDRFDAWALADRIVVMMAGRIVADATPEELLASPGSVEVARFVGYDGELATDHGLLMTRPEHVLLDPGGDIEATVDAVVRQPGTVRVRLVVRGGVIHAQDPTGTLRPGDTTRVTIGGGVTYAPAEQLGLQRLV